MFTLPLGIEINKDSILKAVRYNEEERVSKLTKLENYYLGFHDIQDRKTRSNRANNKIAVNHAKYITDVNIGYLLGNPVEYQAKKDVYKIDPIIEAYDKQVISRLDTEIAKDVSIFGYQYEMVYADEESNIASARLDNRNCILVYDDTMEHNKMFAVLYEIKDTYKKEQEPEFARLEVITDTSRIEYTNATGKIVRGKEYAHYFEEIPIVEYINNPELIGDFQVVIPLIDAYNILISDRVNDKEDLVNAVMAIKNMKLSKELLENLKAHRVIADIPPDGDIKYVTKQLNETELSVLRKDIIDDIHKISMTPDMSDENFVGNSSGVAIKYKLLPFEQSVQNKERYFEDGLMDRFSIYNTFLKKKGKMNQIVPLYEVQAIFKRNLPQNDVEIAQIITQLDGRLPEEFALSLLSFVDNAQELLDKLKEEQLKQTTIGSSGFGSFKPNDQNNGDNPEKDLNNN